MAGKKSAQQSVLGERQHFALDAGDCRFAACAIYKHFSVVEFSLLPNRVHARPSAMLRERKPLGVPFDNFIEF